jgi:hypothetical protein
LKNAEKTVSELKGVNSQKSDFPGENWYQRRESNPHLPGGELDFDSTVYWPIHLLHLYMLKIYGVFERGHYCLMPS